MMIGLFCIKYYIVSATNKGITAKNSRFATGIACAEFFSEGDEPPPDGLWSGSDEFQVLPSSLVQQVNPV